MCDLNETRFDFTSKAARALLSMGEHDKAKSYVDRVRCLTLINRRNQKSSAEAQARTKVRKESCIKILNCPKVFSLC